jgi:hypothetical protein
MHDNVLYHAQNWPAGKGYYLAIAQPSFVVPGLHSGSLSDVAVGPKIRAQGILEAGHTLYPNRPRRLPNEWIRHL